MESVESSTQPLLSKMSDADGESSPGPEGNTASDGENDNSTRESKQTEGKDVQAIPETKKAEEGKLGSKVTGSATPSEYFFALLVPLVIILLIGLLTYWHFLFEVRDGSEILRVDSHSVGDFFFEESSLTEIRAAFRSGSLNSVALTRHYLARIERMNPLLRAVIETNPDALSTAAEKDKQRRLGLLDVGVLHGIPLLLTDNIATKDKMNTTVGSFALLGTEVVDDAAVVAKLRESGAIMLGKANMNEWGGWMASNKVDGWSARGGLTRNPYVLDASPCGSSGGAAVGTAANLAFASLGTEAEGFLLCSASSASLVAIKPTVGCVSRAGVITVSKTQDTVGPLARTLTDAVVLLDAISASVTDPLDKSTDRCRANHPTGGFRQFLGGGRAKGKRIGVPRWPFFTSSTGLVADYEVAAHENHIATLRKLGAVIVDNVDFPEDLIEAILEGTISHPATAESTVLSYEFKAGTSKYLRGLGVSSPVRNLQELIEFNINNGELELNMHNQQLLVEADAVGSLEDIYYKKALELNKEYTRSGIDLLMEESELDLLIAPTSSKISKIIALDGYPGVTIPAGYAPGGVEGVNEGEPFGLAFVGRACSETVLIEVAHAFEQATLLRKAPPPINAPVGSEFESNTPENLDAAQCSAEPGLDTCRAT